MKMRNLLSTAVLVTLFMSLTGCNGSGDKVELVPVKTSKTGNWSMLSSDGTIKYDAEFKGEPTMCYGGVFTVKNDDGTYALYSSKGKTPEEIEGCDSLYQAGMMDEGVMPVTKKGSHIELIDKKGESVAKLDKCDGQQIIKSHGSVGNGLLGVTVVGNKCGYVDKTGKTVIQPKYDVINIFKDGYALVGTKDGDDNMKYQIIDTDGKTVVSIKDKYHPATIMIDGRILLKEEESERYCVMDKEGNVTKFPEKAEAFFAFDGNYFIFRNEGQYGVMDMNGEIVIRPKYYKLDFCGDDTFWAQKQRDSGFVKLNAKGETLAEIDYSELSRLINGVGFFAKDGSTWTLIDGEGKPKGKEDFYEVSAITSFCEEINSDYFDYEAAVAQAVDYITAGNIPFGKDPQKVFTDVTPDYSYAKTSAVIKSKTIEGFKYGIFVEADFGSDMATWSGSGYAWNPDAQLRMYGVVIATDTKINLTKEDYDSLIKALESKGFKKVKYNASNITDSKCNCLLEKGDTAVLVMMTTGGRMILSGVFKKSDKEIWDDALEMTAETEASGASAPTPGAGDETVTASTAESAPAAAPASSGNDFVAMVTQRKLTAQDLAPYSKAQLRLMRNTIYAIHGRKFTSKDLQQYFSQFAWYKPRVSEVSKADLSPIEQYNVTFIQKYE